MNIIKKITLYTLSFLLILPAIPFTPNVANAVSGCEDIQMGFVTMNIQITDMTSGNSGGGFATSSDPTANGTAKYTEGADVYISLNGGGNQQADVPVHVTLTGFTSDQGNTIDFDDYGQTIPGYSGYLSNFHADNLTAVATQCPSDTATVYVSMTPLDPNSKYVSTTANLAIYDYPTVDLKVNGSSSATIPVGSSATLSWTPTATTSGKACHPKDTWAATGNKDSTPGTTYSESTGTMSTQGIFKYTLSCSGGPASAQVESNPAMTVTLTVGTPPDFSVSCQPPQNTVFQGDLTSYALTPTFLNGFGSNIHWAVKSISPTSGAPTVTIDENDLADDTIAADVSNTSTVGNYTIIFSATGTYNGTTITHDCDAVYLLVKAAPTPTPPTVTTDTSVCGKVTVNWASSGTPAATGFKVYRGSSSNANDPSFVVISGGSQLGANVRTYLDSANPPSSNNYYKVRAFNGAYAYADSAAVLGNSTPCAPKLDRSNKQLIGVSGHHKESFDSNPCGTGTVAALKNNAVFIPGDKVKFQINICNSGTADMTNVNVNDNLYNSNSANTQYTLELIPSSISSANNCATAVAPQSHSVAFTIANIPKPSNPSNPTYCSITMEATIVSPNSPSGNYYRFQNVADITANGLSAHISTPPYLFSLNGDVPNRYETAPQ